MSNETLTSKTLVAKLRSYSSNSGYSKFMSEAADEIERLQGLLSQSISDHEHADKIHEENERLRATAPPSDARLALSIADEHFGYPARGNAVDVTCMCSYCQYARARGPVTKVSAPSCPVCFAEPDEAHALSCRYVLTDETGESR